MIQIIIITKKKIPRNFFTSFILECPVDLFISPASVFSHAKFAVNGRGKTQDNALV